KLRLHFYPKIFDNEAVNQQNWKQFKVETFEDTSAIQLSKAFLPLLFFNLLFIVLGWSNFRNNKLQTF
ncbi:ABC transporter permease, partial [Flavobacterium circumlabens]